jgi:hypothetical protein
MFAFHVFCVGRHHHYIMKTRVLGRTLLGTACVLPSSVEKSTRCNENEPKNALTRSEHAQKNAVLN